MTCGARVMQTDQPEHFIVKHDRHDQKRARSQALCEETHFVIEFRRRSIIQLNRPSHIQVLRQRRDVHGNACLQTGRNSVIRAPFMTDAQLAFGRELDDVAAIDFHHSTQFGHDYLEE